MASFDLAAAAAAIVGVVQLGMVAPVSAQSFGWSDVGGGVSGTGASDSVRAMAPYDDLPYSAGQEFLFVAGSFDVAGSVPASQIARWDGSSWSSVGSGLNKSARDLATFDFDGEGPLPELLYVGGDFTGAGGLSANGIASWDGMSWSPLGSGVNGQVWAIFGFDVDQEGPLPPRLYVGGEFTSAGGAPASQIATWDGSAWAEVGGGVVSTYPGNIWGGVYTFGHWDADGSGPALPLLVVGGGFDLLGGTTTANLIATWDGFNWGALGAGIGGKIIPRVRGAVSYDEDGEGGAEAVLMTAGVYLSAGGQPAYAIARWDGAGWSGVDGGLTGGEPNTNSAGPLVVHDEDGAGPLRARLFVAGKFLMAGGIPANKIAAWDGTSWGALGSGLEGVRADNMVVFDDDGEGLRPAGLYAGGEFDVAGGVSVSRIARWGYCYSDCDQDLSLDFFDFQCFQNRFLLSEAYTDCDGNGAFDLFDFLCFVSSYNAGCY